VFTLLKRWPVVGHFENCLHLGNQDARECVCVCVCVCAVCVQCVYLKDVEGLKLDVGALVPQQVHHQLEVLWPADVARHHREVVAVQQQLAQQLGRESARIMTEGVFFLVNHSFARYMEEDPG